MLKRGLQAVVLTLTLVLPCAAPAQDKDKSMEEIAKYREMLADGNPAELLEMKGEELWKTRRGPKNESLEKCDLGLGAGVVDGAYAQLPRYFADAGKVQDAETRVLYCMTTLQGLEMKELTKNWWRNEDLIAVVTWLGGKSNGMKISMPLKHAKEREAYQIGQHIFHRRSGPQDFGCSICHGQDGVRIRLQDLDNLSQPKGAGKAMSTWPSYRVSQGQVWTMQRRLIDCMRQARWPEPKFPSESVTALQVYLQKNAEGAVLNSPGIKR